MTVRCIYTAVYKEKSHKKYNTNTCGKKSTHKHTEQNDARKDIQKVDLATRG